MSLFVRELSEILGAKGIILYKRIILYKIRIHNGISC